MGPKETIKKETRSFVHWVVESPLTITTEDAPLKKELKEKIRFSGGNESLRERFWYKRSKMEGLG